MLLALLFLIVSSEVCDTARILGIIPSASYSHQIVFRPIWKELADRGHEVVVVTTDPEGGNHPRLKEINVDFVYEDWREFIRTVEENLNPFFLVKYVKRFTMEICRKELAHPEVSRLLRNETERFDLVMAELFYPLMFGLGHRFDCPVIGLSSLDIPNAFYSVWGNPVHPVAYPDVFIAQRGGAMDFWMRLESVLYELFLMTSHALDREWRRLERRFIEEHFGLEDKVIEDLMRMYVSMVFINVPPTLSMRPIGPNVVNIGGNLHINPPKNLTKDLQDFLDDAPHGAIYFSLGTNVKSSMISPALRNIFLATFRELPQKILWKFDFTDLPDVPGNVKIMEWLPQQDILRHPNIKAFVFQGGFQSMEEAILNHIPMVGIPFISDQYANVKRMAENGFGIQLDRRYVTKDSLKSAIKEIIENPRYKHRIVEIAKLIRDQPMTGLEKAVWWTEYVLRTKGARHLRNPIVDMPFYQYYLLDVIAFLVVVSLLFFCAVLRTYACVRSYFAGKSRKLKQQ